jgi:hypothetical protein
MHELVWELIPELRDITVDDVSEDPQTGEHVEEQGHDPS